jgi:hypothetical protein
VLTGDRVRTSDDQATPLDQNLEPQFQDEFVVGADYQFGAAWSTGIRVIQRRLGQVVEDVGVLTTSPITPAAFVVTNPGRHRLESWSPKAERDYRAIELVLQRRHTKNWQLQSSFVYARNVGNYEGLYMTAQDANLPNWTPQFDIPAFAQNAYGKLSGDRPYQVKIHSSYRLPFDLTVSEAFSLSAGSPISALGPELPSTYGPFIYLLPRGSAGRTPTHWTLDLHADYPVYDRSNRSVRLIIDAFNATNQHAPIVMDQFYIYRGMPGFAPWRAPDNLDSFGNPRFNPDLPSSAYFNTPRVYQAPRSFQLGAKFTY